MNVPADCARGCTDPCHCEGCRIIPDEHDPIPRPTEQGQLCRACAKRLRRWLDHVLNDTATLTLRIPDDYTLGQGARHTKISGSPALIRLDVAALLDWRTLRDDDDDATEPISIPKVIIGWAGLVAEEHHLVSPWGTMAAAVALLTAWYPKVTEAEWVPDFYRDMDLIQRLLRSAHRTEPPHARGRCLTCDEPLYQQLGDGEERVQCRRCDRRYTGLDLVRLEVQRRRDANIPTRRVTS